MTTQTARSFAQNVDKLAGDKSDDFIEQIQKIAKNYAAQVDLDYKGFKTANSKLRCLE